MAKPTIVTRAGKGSALTWTEGDSNLTNLQNATFTLEAGTGGTDVVSNLNGLITLVAGTNVTLSGDNTAKTVTINSTASGGASTLDGLTDVVITAAATDDALIYNGTNWVDTALSGVTVGTASVGSTVTLTNDESTNAVNYPLFVNATTGNLSPRTDSALTYNPSTGIFATTGKFTKTGGASGANPWATSAGFVTATGTYTDTTTTGTLAIGYVNAFNTPTYTATNALTITQAANLWVAAPVAGTNVTFTNAWSIQAGGRIKASALDDTPVGSTTANTGVFTTLSATGAVTLSPANLAVAISPTGTGTVAISPAGALTINPTTASTINNTSIGVTTAAAGRFTTLTATSTTTLATSLTGLLKAASGVVSTATAGTDYVAVSGALGTPSSGTVTNLTGTASININGTVGATTANTGAFTTLSATGAVTMNPASAAVSISPTGTGTVAISPAGALTINPTTASTINNTSIGATTASTGRFTTVTSTQATGTAPFTVASTTNVANLNASSLNGATFANPGAIGGTTAAAGTFTALNATGADTFYKLQLDPTALSAGAWNNNGIGIRGWATTFTDTNTTGTISTSYVHALQTPTLASTNVITVQDAVGLYVAAPVAGTNTTITNIFGILSNGRIKGSDFVGTIGATTANTGAFTTLSASSTVSGTGFSTYLASPPAIGGTAAAAGSFTTTTVRSANDLRLNNSADTFYVALKAGTLSANTTYTLPTAYPSITGYVLSSTTAGVLTWVAQSGGSSFDPANPGAIGGTTPAAGSFTTLSASSTVSGTGFSTYLQTPPSIGASIANTGAFTSLTASGAVTFSPSSASITLNPGVAGSIGNMSIGATNPSTGSFTTLTANTITLDDVRETIYTSGSTTGTITPDVSNGTVQKITLTGSITFNAFANPVSGQSLTLIITNSAGGGLTLTSTMKFAGASKTLSTGANAIDILTVFYDGTNYFASLGKGFA